MTASKLLACWTGSWKGSSARVVGHLSSCGPGESLHVQFTPVLALATPPLHSCCAEPGSWHTSITMASPKNLLGKVSLQRQVPFPMHPRVMECSRQNRLRGNLLPSAHFCCCDGNELRRRFKQTVFDLYFSFRAVTGSPAGDSFLLFNHGRNYYQGENLLTSVTASCGPVWTPEECQPCTC